MILDNLAGGGQQLGKNRFAIVDFVWHEMAIYCGNRQVFRKSAVAAGDT